MDPRVNELPKNRVRPKGGPPNLCPFGCTDRELDQHGYCRHLYGFTEDGHTVEVMEVRADDGGYEKPVLNAEGRVVQPGGFVPKLRTGKVRGEVLETDVVVERNTPTSRVYRPGPGDKRVVRSAEPGEGIAALEALAQQQQRQIDEQRRQIDELLTANRAEMRAAVGKDKAKGKRKQKAAGRPPAEPAPQGEEAAV